MDAAQALADLTEISSQIEAARRPRRRRRGRSPRRSTDAAPPSASRARRHRAARRPCGALAGDGGGEPAQLEAALGDGSVFVVRDGETRRSPPRRGPEPTVGLVFYDLKSCLRSVAGGGRSPSAKPRGRGRATAMPRRRVAAGFLLGGGSLAGAVFYRRRAARRRERVDVYFEDGSMVSLAEGSPEARDRLLPLARRISTPRRCVDAWSDAALAAALREHAYLEGDFVLRSGRRSRYYLDKYRFETRPDLLGPLGERIAAEVAELEPDAERLAGPELGAVALAAAASLASGLPFLIVRARRRTTARRTGSRARSSAGERVVPRRGRRHLGRRGARGRRGRTRSWSGMSHAVCVVDREEGGVDALARLGVRLGPCFRAAEVVQGR